MTVTRYETVVNWHVVSDGSEFELKNEQSSQSSGKAPRISSGR